MYCKYKKIYENLSDKVYFEQPSRLNVLKKEIFLTPTYHIRNSLGLLGLSFSDDTYIRIVSNEYHGIIIKVGLGFKQ